MRLCHCRGSSSLSLITAVCASILRPSLMLRLCDLLLWGCSAWLHQRCGFSCSLWLYYPISWKRLFLFSFLHRLQSLACVQLLYSAAALRCEGLINGTFNLWPRKPEWIPSCTLFPQGHSENSVQSPALKKSFKFSWINSVPLCKKTPFVSCSKRK